LKDGSPPLGVYYFLPVWIGSMINELQRNLAVRFGIDGQVHAAHAAERKEFDDSVLAELAWMHAQRAPVLSRGLLAGG
jgi:hypothetical protein